MTDTDDGTAVVVLVAEDETLVRLLANDILTEAGYRVLEARDGQEALTIWKCMTTCAAWSRT
jgi:CheY-like chemotaxis protein